MAFTATVLSDSTRLRPAWSNGFGKTQLMTWTMLTTDTSGTVTAPNLVEIQAILLDGVNLSTAATFSGNVATLTFTAAGTTGAVAGTLVCMGV